MRRYIIGALLSLFILQSSGAALANAPGDPTVHVAVPNIASVLHPLLSAIEGSQVFAEITGSGDRYALMHMQMPRLTRRNVRTAAATPSVSISRLVRPVEVHGTPEHFDFPKHPPRERTRDPLAMHRASSSGVSSLAPRTVPGRAPTGAPVLARPGTASPMHGASPRTAPGSTANAPNGPARRAPSGPSPNGLASTDSGAGINRWWTYEGRTIPGVGNAMVNVGTGNLVVQTTDVDIPERGVDLAFTRTYNSQSLHDSNGDDGSEPSVFGNLWTNTYDAHIVFRYSGQTINAVSVYDVDGTRCDYTPDGNGNWVPCTGQHATLEVDPSNSCMYWWIRKDGSSLLFHTDAEGGGCTPPAANLGRLYAVYGRNSNNNITFNYSFSGGHTSQNITQIVVNHSDGQSLTLNFAQFSGVNELSTITYPKPNSPGQTVEIRYNYDTVGDLLEVDKPGNDATPNLSSYGVPAGDLPQTYGYTQPLQFLNACGPRATISLWLTQGNATDGACMHFDFDSSVRLVDWQGNGVINPTINGTIVQPTQPTGWNQIYQENFIYGTRNNPPCTGTLGTTTTMCDTDGHAAIWTPDSLYRITQMQVATGDKGSGPSALVSTQTWDNSNNETAAQSPQEYENSVSTNTSYDTNGNVTKVQLPSISTSGGSLRPTTTFTYDQYSNLTSACDAVYNANNSGACSTTPGSGSVVLQYDTGNPDSAEPYGKVTYLYNALGYRTQFMYSYNSSNEPGDYGLPTAIEGQQINQLDGTSPTPQRNLTYDAYGNITVYGTGLGTWNMTYNDDNWPTAVSDPDNVTARKCFNNDGSINATQSALQYSKDNHQVCGTESTAYAHDTDGNVLGITHHFNDQGATTNKFYDGLDRLVEVDEPMGNKLRYFYDITQNGGGSPNLTISGWNKNFDGYGNLYKVQRYFTIPGGENQTWNDINGNAFDALNRPVSRFQRTPGSATQYPGATEAWTSAYDSSGQYGLLSSGTDPLNIVTTFGFDNAARLLSKSFSDGTTPNVTYVNDPDGRIHKATSSVFGDETYTYDANGDVVSYAEGGGPSAMHPTISYGYYPNGWRSSLTINAGSLFNSGSPEFTYDYQMDGLRKTLTVAGKTNPFSWQYTQAGRPTSQSDPWTGKAINGTSSSLQATTMAFDLSGNNPTGVLTGMTLPVGAAYQNMTHDAEGEVTSFGVGAPPAFTPPVPNPSVTAANIGYDSQGRFISLGGTSAVLGSGNYQTVTSISYSYGRPSGPTIDPYTGSAVTGEASPGSCGSNVFPQYKGLPNLTFDAAGRDASTATTDCSNNQFTSDQRVYDDENHTATDTACADATNGCSPSNGGTANAYGWAASGNLRTYSAQSSSTSNYRFHWDGSNLLFVTDGNGNLIQLNVEKLAIATYNPQSNSETDFVVYDRDFSGTNVDQHGKAGDGGVSIMPSYSKITNYKFGWTTSQLTGGFPAEGTTPSAPTFDMPRTDGYQVGALVLQGVRAYDPSIEQWTTPDSFKGSTGDPTSQWAYSWNAGNPITNSDPSGFEPISAALIALPLGIIVGATIIVGGLLLLPEEGLGTVGLLAGPGVAVFGVIEGLESLWPIVEALPGYSSLEDGLTFSLAARAAPVVQGAGMVAAGVTADAVYGWVDQQIPVGQPLGAYTCVTLLTMSGVPTSGACSYGLLNPRASVGDANNVLGDSTVGQLQGSIYGINYMGWASQNADPYFDTNLMQ